MNPEQRVIQVEEYFVVECFVFFIGTVFGLFQPQGRRIVQRFGFFLFFLFFFTAFSAFCFFCFIFVCFCQNFVLCQCGSFLLRNMDGVVFFLGFCFFYFFFVIGDDIDKDRNGHECAVFLQCFVHLAFIQEFFAVFAHVQCDGGTAFGTGAVCHFVVDAVCTAPFCCCCAGQVGQCINFYFIGYHESGVEAQTEMTDDFVVTICFFFVFGQEICCAGEGDLVDVFLDFLVGHTDTVIHDLHDFFVFVQYHMNGKVFISGDVVCFPHDHQLFQFGYCVTGIGYQFTDENILIGIEPFFDNW